MEFYTVCGQILLIMLMFFQLNDNIDESMCYFLTLWLLDEAFFDFFLGNFLDSDSEKVFMKINEYGGLDRY